MASIAPTVTAAVSPNGFHSYDWNWSEVLQRLDDLEICNSALVKDNAALRASISSLEQQAERLTQQVTDTAAKVKIMRDTKLVSPVAQVIDTFDVLERILEFCPRKQLFAMQSVSKSFSRTINASLLLRSKMHSNARDVISEPLDAASTELVWDNLELNRLFAEDWTNTDFATFIHLRIFKPQNSNLARYLVDTELAATFECRIVSSDQSHYALKGLQTSLGRTYMTRPALPTTVWVAFLVPSLIEEDDERQRALRSPASVPPNATATVDVVAATLLEMYEVAEVMRKYFPRNWAGHPRDAQWRPQASPLAEHDGMLRRAAALMRSPPQYAGWMTMRSRAHTMSDAGEWV